MQANLGGMIGKGGNKGLSFPQFSSDRKFLWQDFKNNLELGKIPRRRI
jgi:hypothetical protein